MLSYAILIDAGFAKKKLYPLENPVTADTFERFVEGLRAHHVLRCHRLHRVYFYDAKPLTDEVAHPNGTRVNFGASVTAVANQALHSGLERANYFAMRYGELVHQGWRIKGRSLRRANPDTQFTTNDLEANVQQKAVDMRIGLDIASLTLKKQVDMIVLVTADSDFIPAMKFARREGAQLVLVTLAHGLREPVHQHADILIHEHARTFLRLHPPTPTIDLTPDPSIP
ncbi:TPA: NYN domain-containing protein [Pseudomonas aeruginosa]